VKSINLLPNVLAKQAAAAAGAFEAALVRDGTVTEGAHTTLFAVIDGVLRTHPLTHGILPGITRAVVLELAAELDLPVREVAFDVGALHAADELFLASTTADVMPIVSVDGRSAGGGAPGPITRALVEAMAARLGRAVVMAGR
jgi:D-alanine transaminase